MPLRAQRRGLHSGSLDADPCGLRSLQNRISPRRKTRWIGLQALPHTRARKCNGAPEHSSQRRKSNLPRTLKPVRKLPPRRAPGTSRAQLPVVSQLRGLEDDFDSVRSLQNEVPTHRCARRCRLPEVPYRRCRRQATLRRSSVRSLCCLPLRSSQGQLREFLPIVPQHQQLESDFTQQCKRKVRSHQNTIPIAWKAQGS